MCHVADDRSRVRQHTVLRSMFEAHKRVFIDLLKRDLPARTLR